MGRSSMNKLTSRQRSAGGCSARYYALPSLELGTDSSNTQPSSRVPSAMIRRVSSYQSGADCGVRDHKLAAMGKVAVRLKEVVYMVSPFEVSIRITLALQLENVLRHDTADTTRRSVS